ncbi:MAG: methylated-DNA--[protein]-cysteine S-methyltransferase, partial [Candidatus Micrarchaeaceae archaeon]
MKELDGYCLTEFQKRVLVATVSVKRGCIITYKQLAARVGSPNAYRAVGTALRLNPFPIRIPCHRVVKSDGSIGGYSAAGGSRK